MALVLNVSLTKAANMLLGTWASCRDSQAACWPLRFRWTSNQELSEVRHSSKQPLLWPVKSIQTGCLCALERWTSIQELSGVRHSSKQPLLWPVNCMQMGCLCALERLGAGSTDSSTGCCLCTWCGATFRVTITPSIPWPAKGMHAQTTLPALHCKPDVVQSSDNCTFCSAQVLHQCQLWHTVSSICKTGLPGLTQCMATAQFSQHIGFWGSPVHYQACC